MKKNIEILKSYFEKGDRPTQREFGDLIDSFLHKDDGAAIKDISKDKNGDFVFTLSDGTEQVITQSSSGLPSNFLEELQNSLDGKVDKVTGKQLSAEDFTSSLKAKVEQLENYVHPDFHQISDVENLQETLDTKIGATDVTTAALSGLEIRDENGAVQFTADEYIELEGVSFDPATNRIKFIDDATTYYYVHSVVGDDTTGGINNPSKPYKTIDGVFANYDKTIDLDREYLVIILVNQATHVINERVPFLNVEFRSNLFVNISFTGNTNAGNLFYTNNGSRTIRWYFNIPNGRLIDNKTTGFSSLNTEDLICYFNVNEINITSPGGNARYFGRTYYVENINRLIMRTSMGLCRTRRLQFELINATGYGANAALLAPIDSLGFEVSTNQLITGDVGLIRIVRSGKIAFESVSGNLRFHYSNSPIVVEFLNTPEATVLLVQTVTQVTFTGYVKLLNFTGNSTNGAIDFVNLTVGDSTGTLTVSGGNLNYKNCSIVTDSYLMTKSNIGRVRIDNTTIRQKNPASLINSTGSGITIDVGGLSTNAISLSNNANDTLIQDFKDFGSDTASSGFNGIEVRDGNGNVQFTADEFLEFSGASFDPINKRVQISSLSPYTIYVDSVNGDDATAQLFNSDKPFKTFLEAYNNIPNDGNLWTLYYIDSGTRDLTAISGKPVRIFTNNTGTFRFLNQTAENLTNVPYFEIDAPRANLIIESASQNSIRPTNFKINVNVLYQRALHQGFIGFWGSDADSSSVNGYIKAKTFRVEVNSVRLFNYHGDFEVDRYVCAASAVRLKNDITTLTNFKVNEVHSEGFETNLEFLHGQDHLHKIRLYAGTHKINNGLLKVLDVTGVTFTCPSFRYSHNGVLTGRMFNNGYDLELDYYNIFNYIGRLTRRGSIGRGMNIRKSTIYLDNQLQTIGNHIDLSGQVFVFEDIKIIQNSPTYLFGNIDEAISITQIGYFIGTHNALSGGGSLQEVNINEILKSELSISSLDSYIDDASAALGGVLVGQPYINSNTGALHRRLA